MDSLARLVVHVEEAIRLSRDETDLASLRLGLMLFDAAAELLLHRSAVYFLAEDSIEQQTLNRYQNDVVHLQKTINQSDDGDQALLNSLQMVQTKVAEQEGIVLDTKRRERIERRFKDKAQFVVEKTGALPSSALAVMKKLHRYRNDTYHQDTLRPATLAASTQIYGHIVLDLMTALKPKGGTESRFLPPRLAKYFPEDAGLHEVISEGQSRIADALRREHSMVLDRGLAEALALHAIDRLDQLDEIVSSVASYLSSTSTLSEEWTPEATLHYVQLDVPPIWTARDAEAQDVPIRGKHLRDWRMRAEDLGSESDAINAFEKFSRIEDEVDQIETELHREARIIDEYEDREFRRSRGN